MSANSRPTTVVSEPSTPTPGVIVDLQVDLVTADSVQLSWGQPELNGTTLVEYVIQRRDTAGGSFIDVGISTTPTFTDTGLSASTVYSYRVRAVAVEGAGASGNVVDAETYPNIALLNEEYAFFSVANITSVYIVAIDNGVTITQTAAGGSVTTIGPLTAGQTYTGAAAQFDSFIGDGAFHVHGLISNDWFTINPNYTAGKSFAYGPIRNNPQTVSVYAIEDANITITFDGTQVASAFVPAGTGSFFSYNGVNANTVIDSDAFVIAAQTSNGSVDQTVLMPASNRMVGVPSNSARVYPTEPLTTWGAYRSDGSPFGGGGHEDTTKIGTIDGTGSQYTGDAVYVECSKPMTAASFADSDGGKAAPFLPVGLMRTRFGLPVIAERTVFVGIEPFTITTSNGNTYTSVGSQACQRVYINAAADRAAGTLFTSSAPVGAWSEPDIQDQDEYILFGFD